MPKEHPIEIFMPPNMLKAKVGGSVAGLDLGAIKRAEAAMDALKTDFAQWIADDVERLGKARDGFAATRSAETREALFRAAHDLKGQGATFEFPLIARMAASLSKLVDALQEPAALPLNLVDAHVDAIRIVFRDKIHDTSNRMAIVLAEELEARVVETLEIAARAA
ncbi:MAG: Hpt domain-containing protein [Alphaproteobacteria bacterium]|nr:Hpt domain-containing protein [Alphaproteobacteria bacterium]MBV9694700.1 Hpt domain-containing protein [Alphaproteobacteria bacterium]